MISLDGIIGGLIGWLLAEGIRNIYKAVKGRPHQHCHGKAQDLNEVEEA